MKPMMKPPPTIRLIIEKISTRIDPVLTLFLFEVFIIIAPIRVSIPSMMAIKPTIRNKPPSHSSPGNIKPTPPRIEKAIATQSHQEG
ncbi:MAG: hypothetical protein QXP55_00400 [Nitrososphaerales archaeon]